MLGEITSDEVRSAVELTVREVLWEAGVERPPVDALLAAQRLGSLVINRDDICGRAERVRLARSGCGGEVILLAPEDRSERRQWAVAHEIGEQHAHRVFANLGLNPAEAPGGREAIANRFASGLLLPERWFLPEAQAADWDLPQLKRAFATASHELIALRMLELCEQPIAVTVIDNGSQTWRRASRWRPPPPCSVELDAWQQAYETARPCDFTPRRGNVARVRAWPVHEPGWKREVVLTEFVEDE